ncbi:membrane protein [Microbacterium phage JRok]|uniref:Membrane protein n=1 Tax=Microbacterium phage Azizam TaxID=2656547 RepID=A0A649VY36_9CAUD|nr:membrane protein [Microbacterium phage Azizam]QJD53916.2 membrane protein [Microbacterium phage McShie]QNJ56060.2 membrane protein [Microbacterium phage JRok]QXO14235.2 membrane protein [Microbacterium phage BrokMonster]
MGRSVDGPRHVTATEWALIIVAVVGASGAWLNARYGRMGRIERRLASVEVMNNRLWAYIRQQHDHAYRSGYVPLPIPDHLFENGDPE